MIKEYMQMPPDARMVLFSLESVFALEVGGGEVFQKGSRREVSDVRHSFIYILNNHYKVSQPTICGWLRVNQIGRAHV